MFSKLSMSLFMEGRRTGQAGEGEDQLHVGVGGQQLRRLAGEGVDTLDIGLRGWISFG